MNIYIYSQKFIEILFIGPALIDLKSHLILEYSMRNIIYILQNVIDKITLKVTEIHEPFCHANKKVKALVHRPLPNNAEIQYYYQLLSIKHLHLLVYTVAMPTESSHDHAVFYHCFTTVLRPCHGQCQAGRITSISLASQNRPH